MQQKEITISEQHWQQLYQQACSVMAKAYAPYSNYPVGAAALTANGKIVKGCNIENASYGVTLCAECSLISDLITSDEKRIVAFVCVDGSSNYLVPCGRCRQLLYEHGGKELQIKLTDRIYTLDQLLPQAFGPEYLAS